MKYEYARKSTGRKGCQTQAITTITHSISKGRISVRMTLLSKLQQPLTPLAPATKPAEQAMAPVDDKKPAMAAAVDEAKKRWTMQLLKPQCHFSLPSHDGYGSDTKQQLEGRHYNQTRFTKKELVMLGLCTLFFHKCSKRPVPMLGNKSSLPIGLTFLQSSQTMLQASMQKEEPS